MALNIYSLSAYYLRPKYHNERLTNENKNVVNNFLFKHLDGEGIEWDKFNEKRGVFKLLIEKDI
jgi:hypothetical protein